MAVEVMTPDGWVVQEDGTDEYVLPGGWVFNEDEAGAPAQSPVPLLMQHYEG